MMGINLCDISLTKISSVDIKLKDVLQILDDPIEWGARKAIA